MLQMTKSQRKKAKKQQKAAMQLTQSSLDSPSTRDCASSAPTTTSGAELQVCPLINLLLTRLRNLLLHLNTVLDV
jgi:hypothetical protein